MQQIYFWLGSWDPNCGSGRTSCLHGRGRLLLGTDALPATPETALEESPEPDCKGVARRKELAAPSTSWKSAFHSRSVASAIQTSASFISYEMAESQSRIEDWEKRYHFNQFSYVCLSALRAGWRWWKIIKLVLNVISTVQSIGLLFKRRGPQGRC